MVQAAIWVILYPRWAHMEAKICLKRLLDCRMIFSSIRLSLGNKLSMKRINWRIWSHSLRIKLVKWKKIWWVYRLLIKRQVRNFRIWWSLGKRVIGWCLQRRIKIWRHLLLRWRGYTASIGIIIEKYTKNNKKRCKQPLNYKRWNNKNKRKSNTQNSSKNKQYGENNVKNSANNNVRNANKSKTS